MTPPQPPKGNMVLWDHIFPPLLDGSYRWLTETDVSYQIASGQQGNPPVNETQNLPEAQGYFNVEGPRFSLDASQIATVFPPRNGHGGFNESLPHVAIFKRTLPWERTLDPNEVLWIGQTPPAWNENVPWMTLLLFEESECTIKQKVAIADALPHAVVKELAPPRGLQVDTVSADSTLVASILPSLEELSLLAHVRQVNVEDRELNTAGGDGWFSVVMSNRVPEEGKKYIACLVSLEERWDVVAQQPPAVATGPIILHPLIDRAELSTTKLIGTPGVLTRMPNSDFPVTSAVNSQSLFSNANTSIVSKFGGISVVGNPGRIRFHFQTTFILLHSWKFECTQAGTFRELMQSLDDKMFGNPNTQNKPQLTDTGHLHMPVENRVGETETTFYRGPLVPFQLTRDRLGPYHSADQCRRGSIESGGEDISYAAAFECGRLLAAADGRLAQDIMRWRREGYKVSARVDSLNLVAKTMNLIQAPDVHQPFSPIAAVSAVQTMVNPSIPVADPFHIGVAEKAIGLNPLVLQKAWNLASAQEAVAMLGGDPGTLGAPVTAPAQTPRPNTTLEAVAADSAGLARLNGFRNRLLENANATWGGK